MSQIYNNIKRPKLQDIPPRILKIYTFTRKFSRVTWVQKRGLLEGSMWSIVKVGVEATC